MGMSARPVHDSRVDLRDQRVDAVAALRIEFSQTQLDRPRVEKFSYIEWRFLEPGDALLIPCRLRTRQLANPIRSLQGTQIGNLAVNVVFAHHVALSSRRKMRIRARASTRYFSTVCTDKPLAVSGASLCK